MQGGARAKSLTSTLEGKTLFTTSHGDDNPGYSDQIVNKQVHYGYV